MTPAPHLYCVTYGHGSFFGRALQHQADTSVAVDKPSYVMIHCSLTRVRWTVVRWSKKDIPNTFNNLWYKPCSLDNATSTKQLYSSVGGRVKEMTMLFYSVNIRNTRVIIECDMSIPYLNCVSGYKANHKQII